MNNEIFYFFYNLAHQNIYFDKLVYFIAEYFGNFVILFAIIFLLFHHEVFGKEHPLGELKRKYKEIFLFFYSSVLAWLISLLLKLSFAFTRPFELLQGVNPLFLETDHSFPSGHSTFFMALGVAIFLRHKAVGSLFIFFALLIGISRIISGVHFPIDILGGYAIGIFIVFFLHRKFKI